MPDTTKQIAAHVTDAVRPGSVCVDHGFGSRVFDPLSGTAALNDRYVAVAPVRSPQLSASVHTASPGE